MDKSKHTPGTFCWHELHTTDQDRARQFYSSLFGWTAREIPRGGDNGTYTILQHRGREVAALTQMKPDPMAQKLSSHWMSFVSVEDADQTARNARELGGTVVAGPLELFDAGRMAMLVDPAGAPFAIWQPRK